MPRPVNRMTPVLPAEAMKSYVILAPRATHFRPGSCAEVDCPHLQFGWRTVIDESTDLGRRQAYYIRRESARKFTEDRDATGLTTFTFEAGQRCFRTHQVRLDRPELFVVRGGDWRGNPRGIETRRHTRPEDWVDDFANHQTALADRLRRG